MRSLFTVGGRGAENSRGAPSYVVALAGDLLEPDVLLHEQSLLRAANMALLLTLHLPMQQ